MDALLLAAVVNCLLLVEFNWPYEACQGPTKPVARRVAWSGHEISYSLQGAVYDRYFCLVVARSWGHVRVVQIERSSCDEEMFYSNCHGNGHVARGPRADAIPCLEQASVPFRTRKCRWGEQGVKCRVAGGPSPSCTGGKDKKCAEKGDDTNRI